MKRNSFDLKGKFIDCSDISENVFNAVKLVCSGVDDNEGSNFEDLGEYTYLSLMSNKYMWVKHVATHQIIKPVDILGEQLMKAIELGFTPVFEGDVIPKGSHCINFRGNAMYLDLDKDVVVKNGVIIAYKSCDVSVAYKVDSLTGETTRSPENDFIIKPDFTELKHIDDNPDWKQREKETYGDEEDIESLARDLLLASISREPMSSENYKSKIESVWTIAREFYKSSES